MVEQPRLGLHSPCEAGQRTIRSDDAMARHDDRQRVAAIRRSDSSCLARITHPSRLLPIADRLAEGNATQRFPRRSLEVAPDSVQRDIEVGAGTGEVFAELRGRCHEDACWIVLSTVDRAERHAGFGVLQPHHGPQASFASNKGQWPDGTLDDGLVQGGHDAVPF